jgi:hypothetical protein
MKTDFVIPLIAFIGAQHLKIIAQQPSTNDLWDVSQGIVIVTNSAMYDFDARDIFGATFSTNLVERGNIVFNDGTSNGFVHFVEWRTPSPVTVRSFNLWAAGDGPDTSREMASFRLLAKSPGSQTFNLTLS